MAGPPGRRSPLGEEASAQPLAEHHGLWQSLYAYLRARFGPGPPEPEDIVQQAFARVSGLPADMAPHHPRAYLFRVAVNLMHDEMRTLARRRALATRSASLLAEEPDDAPDAERIVIAREQAAFVKRVVDGMPARHRAYLLASQIEGLSFVEIARQDGVSPSLVRKITDEAIMVCQRSLASGRIDYRGLSRERHARS